MRRVALKIVDYRGPNDEASPPLHYSEALVVLARMPQQPGSGFTTEEMISPLAIIGAIKKMCEPPLSEGEERCVFLEEADWVWLVARLKANKFPFVSQAFKDMVDSVEGSLKVDPNQLNGGLSGGKGPAAEAARVAAQREIGDADQVL